MTCRTCDLCLTPLLQLPGLFAFLRQGRCVARADPELAMLLRLPFDSEIHLPILSGGTEDMRGWTSRL